MARQLQSILRSSLRFFDPFFLRPGFTYSLTDLRADVVAGITVAVIQIPQAMAFALIAGLPAVYGLYASLPGALAAIWGSSRQLSTGPVAVVSLLTFTSLVPFAAPGSPDFIRLAALLAVMAGGIYLTLGLFRLGFVMELVPQSVILGFSSAAAAIIVLTQLPTLLGVSVASHDLVFQNIAEIFLALPHLSFITFAAGLAAIFLLVSARRLPQIFPAALIVIVLGTLASYMLDLGSHGVALVSQLPSHLPNFMLPSFAAVPFFSLLPKAAIIALVGFVGAHATMKNIASKTKEPIDTDQELVGQGLANTVAGFFQGFPISGSLTRTAVNMDAGARTAVSGIVSILVIVLALLFFAPLFAYLPRAVLAGLVVMAALPLIDMARLREMVRISRSDGYVALLTFTMAFLLKPDDAIFIGIVAALMFFLRQTVWGARVFEMGIDKEWNVLRGAIEEDRVETLPGIAIARFGASLYYANASHLMRQVDELLLEHAEREKKAVAKIVFDVSGVHFIDITAMEVFADYIEKLERRGIATGLIYLRKGVRQSLERLAPNSEITILHNLQELRQFGQGGRFLVLSKSQPEKLGRRFV